MSYRSILVHLDTSERTRPRLELALCLAKQFDAYLTGVFSVFTPHSRAFCLVTGAAEYYRGQEALCAERRATAERLFRAELGRAQVAGEWLAPDEHPNLVVTRRGRCADLIIASQDDPNDPDSYVADHFPENLIMSTGRPVLMVPYAGAFPSPGSHVMVAWDGSREATRAVHDALPFMLQAKQTTIVTVNDTTSEPHRGSTPGADIAAVIARHGVSVEVSNIEMRTDASIGDALLSQRADIGADLLVMGGYGHARWQELVMGGATRSILKSMTVPVLLSH